MLLCTCAPFWLSTATYVLPPAGALLSAIALWVARQAHGTSRAVQEISSDQERALSLALQRPTRNASVPVALDRRR